jgi:hypothetical protein
MSWTYQQSTGIMRDLHGVIAGLVTLVSALIRTRPPRHSTKVSVLDNGVTRVIL